MQKKGLYDYYKLRSVLPLNYSIVLVGIKESQKSELPHGIVGIPRTENIYDLVKLYSLADVVTSFSYLETFGLTPVEGFSCGTPSIVYNCTATPELITPEVGYVVTPGNISQVLEAINNIKINGKQRYSIKCRSHALDNYNKDKKYKEYLELYNEKLNMLKNVK
jgi:glycosyltransferase involved in cell wall biosynthesis